jgi:hypothetical protein
MLYSALHLNGGGGDGLSIGGEFNQDISSLVTGQQADVGYIGPGVYNLNNGTLALKQMWIGGPHRGVFNQYGGTNFTGLIHLEHGGAYNFYGGHFGATNIYFTGGTFFQRGGALYPFFWKNGYIRWKYVLEEGINHTGFGFGSAVQLGGTNLGYIFGYYGEGSYTLSNGVSLGELRVGSKARFVQYGGSQTATGIVDVNWGITGRGGGISRGTLEINGGMFSAPGLSIGGYYNQHGGTNTINALTAVDYYGSATLTGGLLMDDDVSVNTSYSLFTQSGGVHIITNQLTIDGPGRYYLDGGELIVSNIYLGSHGTFSAGDGTLRQSGNITCAGGTILCRPGMHQFGRMQLAAQGNPTNSTISLPINTNCLVHFSDSSHLPWTNTATLIISNWSGSLAGGGTHQILFGNSAAALSPAQVAQIRFHQPLGLTLGAYVARILANGEVVPNELPPTGRVPPTLRITAQPNGTFRLTVLGESGANYGIETSSNILDWALWTNQVATNGTSFLVDEPGSNRPLTFYRAILKSRD